MNSKAASNLIALAALQFLTLLGLIYTLTHYR